MSMKQELEDQWEDLIDAVTFENEAKMKEEAKLEVEQLCVEIVQLRARLEEHHNIETQIYDEQWHLGSSVDYSKLVLITNRSDILVLFDEETKQVFEDNIVQVLQAQDEYATSFLRYHSNSAGLELFHLFVVDLLGLNTTSAKIFRNKFDEDFVRIIPVHYLWKYVAAAVVILMNSFFIYWTMLRCLSKGLQWQSQFLVNCLFQLLIEIVFIETLECLFLHYIVPESVREDVRKVIDVLEMLANNSKELLSAVNTANALLHGLEGGGGGVGNAGIRGSYKQHRQQQQREEEGAVGLTGEDLDASNYFFVSKRLAKLRPNLLESCLVLAYRNHFPGLICRTWPHYRSILKTLGHEDIQSGRYSSSLAPRSSSRGYLYFFPIVKVVATMLTLLLQSLGAMPFLFQELVVRLLGTIMVSVMMLFQSSINNPIEFTVFGAIFFFVVLLELIRSKFAPSADPNEKIDSGYAMNIRDDEDSEMAEEEGMILPETLIHDLAGINADGSLKKEAAVEPAENKTASSLASVGQDKECFLDDNQSTSSYDVDADDDQTSLASLEPLDPITFIAGQPKE